MAQVTSKDGTSIAYNRSGSGPALILIDGALCYRGFGPMMPLSELLTPHFTVYTYDRRGRGESGDTAPYAIQREVEDIAALIEAAGGSAYLYGISSGGALALEATRSLPAVQKLAVYEAPFMLDDRPATRPDYLQRFIDLNAQGRRGDMLAHFMIDGVGEPPEAVEGMRGSPVWPALEAIAPTLIYDTQIMSGFLLSPELTQRIAAVQVPTLVMGGGASPESMRQAAQAIAAAIPSAQYQTLEGQTHNVAPDAIAPALIEFFTQKEAVR